MNNLDTINSLIYRQRLAFCKEIFQTVLIFMLDLKSLLKIYFLSFYKIHLKDWCFKRRKIKNLRLQIVLKSRLNIWLGYSLIRPKY